MTIADYDAVMGLWRNQDGIGLSSADEREAIASYLRRNAGLSLVAQSDGTIVGAVLCGDDGRRGFLHHLAVEARWRGSGIGTRLMETACRQLAARGIDKCHILVYAGNTAGHGFWSARGWQRRRDIVLFSRDLRQDDPRDDPGEER